MKISTKGRYGTRALFELALRYGQGPVPLRDIAKSQEISLQYLEHIIKPLVTAWIIGSTPGVNGGVWLARKPEEVTLGEALALLEGSFAPVACVGNPGLCQRADACVTRDIWSELKKAMNGVLDGTTLQDMVERQKKKELAGPVMYNI